MSENKYLIIAGILIAALLLKATIARIFDPSIYRGPYYSVKIPAEWKKETTPNEVSFYSPDTNIMTGQPDAVFSIYSHQSKSALFIENVMSDVFEELSKADGKILDQGEIKVDGVISKWLVYRNNNPSFISLTFFIVDDFNRLTRVQYSTKPEKFKEYRPPFEKFKDSIKFKKLF